jgi:5-methylcytosine-specific restriction endonuclease McrA
MSLKNLSNCELILSTRSALRDLRQAEVHLLRHFGEIAKRRLWTEAGSLYKFLARTFELTDDQIYPRLQALRLLQALPELEVKLESGQLSVTNALKAQQVFAAESKKRLVPLEEKRELMASLENASTREADRVLAIRYPQSKSLPEMIRPVAANQNLIQFYVDDETLKQIEELKARFSHQMPSGRMEDLIKILIRKVNRPAKPRAKRTQTAQTAQTLQTVKVEQVEQTEQAEQRHRVATNSQGQPDAQAQKSAKERARTQSSSPTQDSKTTQVPNHDPVPSSNQVKKIVTKARSRYISVVAKRELEKTRANGCAHKDRGTGRRCGSTYFLQMDHVHEFSCGGSNAVDNLQWLCGFHNRHRFETGGGESVR